MSKRKWSRVGWMGRSVKGNPITEVFDGFYNQLSICENAFISSGSRGRTTEWDKEDWPPRKVRVTVEEI